MSAYFLAIDQGTTSTRSMVFDDQGQCVSSAQQDITQYYPQPGWVEHDPEDIWQSVVTTMKRAVEQAPCAITSLLAMGVSNQRETTLLWDRKTGTPCSRAIVWQDRRTADACNALKEDATLARSIQKKTGLLIDPYFSATKIRWLLDQDKERQIAAEQGELCFGTLDTFLIWRLTQGKQHITDTTNASRTLLFNLHTGAWDQDLLDAFNIPAALLPEVVANQHHFGHVDSSLLGYSLPITAALGDQQAAAFGQACFEPGMVKSTYGTGGFMLLNTGSRIIHSQHRLLSTVAYHINDHIVYGLEGSIFVAGAAIQWLRDAAQMIETAEETAEVAASVEDNEGVYLVPAFTGLGAPYWDPMARGALLGLTRNTGVAHIVRAALEATCYQTHDLLNAMKEDTGLDIQTLRVDGGMSNNPWLLKFLANILQVSIQKPHCAESSARGAAFMAGLGIGYYASLHEIHAQWQLETQFEPSMPLKQRDQLYQGWQDAVARVCEPTPNHF